MSSLFPLSSISSEKLGQRAYEQDLPEYYLLENFTENNTSHQQQDVLTHVIKVYKGLEESLNFTFLALEEKTKVQVYLQEKIGAHTREDLLRVSTLLHDIAKSKTIFTDKEGQTQAPGHEIIGSRMAQAFAERFQLDANDLKQVENIVLFHGLAHQLLQLNQEQPGFYAQILQAECSHFYIELLLLIRADVLGGDSQVIAPEHFASKMQMIDGVLKEALKLNVQV
jgi:hypothetical protein